MFGATHKKSDPHTLSDRQTRIYEFLQSMPVGVLSTVGLGQKPHGSVIYFTIDENFKLSFLTKRDTRKYENLQYNPAVTITVFEPKTQATAQIMGEAVEVKDTTEMNRIAAVVLDVSLRTSQSGLPPISKLEAGPYVAFHVKPEQIRLAVYSRPDAGTQADLFESLESFELNPY